MVILLSIILEADVAFQTFQNNVYIIVLFKYFLLEHFSNLSLLLFFLSLIELLMNFLVQGCVAMFSVNFLALKAFTASHALELISVKEALGLKGVRL